MNINNVVAAGRLGGDPELKETKGGMSVAGFSIATNRVWKDKSGEKQESTEWIRCIAWGKTAETIAQYFRKGKEIYIEGRLQTRSWDGQDGKKNYKTEVVVDRFQFVGYDKDGSGGQNNQQQPAEGRFSPPQAQTAPPIDEEINLEDIPF